MEEAMEDLFKGREKYIDISNDMFSVSFLPERETSKHYAGLIRALKRIEQERRRYQTLFDKAPAGYLIITDVTATIQEANQEAALLLTVSQSDLIGVPLEQFVVAEEREMFRACLEQFR
jgi:PAS domain-containing protein